jgi:hypothetical protein
MAVVGERPQGGQFSLALTLRNSFGRVGAQARPGVRRTRGDTAGGYGSVVILPFRTTPGKHRLQVKMTASRPGLSKNSVGRKQVQSVEGELQVPGLRARRDSLRRRVRVARARARLPPSARMLPNPDASMASTPTASRAASSRAPAARSLAPGTGWRGSWTRRARRRHSRGRAPPASAVEAALAADISKEPAGHYDSRDQGVAGGGRRRAPQARARSASRGRRAPGPRARRRSSTTPTSCCRRTTKEAFALKSPGEQERLMTEFWRVRDPTPDTGENEARETS